MGQFGGSHSVLCSPGPLEEKKKMALGTVPLLVAEVQELVISAGKKQRFFAMYFRMDYASQWRYSIFQEFT